MWRGGEACSLYGNLLIEAETIQGACSKNPYSAREIWLFGCYGIRAAACSLQPAPGIIKATGDLVRT